MSAAEIVAEVVDVDGELIVRRCPQCGKEHRHGRGTDRKPILGHRVSHCRGENKVDYKLVLVGEVKS